jgi:hypothetical protein
MKRILTGLVAAAVVSSTALRAQAEELPAPAHVPVAAEVEPLPPPPPPTDAERKVVVQAAPPMLGVSGARFGPAPCGPPAAACCPPSVCCQPRDACGYPVDACGVPYGRFEATFEGMFSFLSDADDRPFGEDSFDPDQISWSGIEFDGEIGGRVTLAFRASGTDRLEVRGSWFGEWDESATQTGVFGFSPGDDPDGNDVSDEVVADLRVESRLWSAELNWWTEVACEGAFRWDVGVGARYIQFDEDARADVVNTTTLATGSVLAEVENMFVGGQAMAAAHVDFGRDFEGFASVKALVGNLRRNIDVTTDSIFVGGVSAGSSEEDEIVWGLDAELGLKLRLTRWLALTAGYEFLFLDKVQRGFDAMDFSRSDTGSVQPGRDEDQLVVHAFYAGFSITL